MAKCHAFEFQSLRRTSRDLRSFRAAFERSRYSLQEMRKLIGQGQREREEKERERERKNHRSFAGE